MAITADDDVLSGQPRVEGTRIGVSHVYDAVVRGGGSPPNVADALDLTVGEVHEALAYYYDHPDEMTSIREADAALEAKLEELSNAPREATR